MKFLNIFKNKMVLIFLYFVLIAIILTIYNKTDIPIFYNIGGILVIAAFIAAFIFIAYAVIKTIKRK
jgi:hypothetical protein